LFAKQNGSQVYAVKSGTGHGKKSWKASPHKKRATTLVRIYALFLAKISKLGGGKHSLLFV
jgi:hypothetical protein